MNLAKFYALISSAYTMSIFKIFSLVNQIRGIVAFSAFLRQFEKVIIRCIALSTFRLSFNIAFNLNLNLPAWKTSVASGHKTVHAIESYVSVSVHKICKTADIYPTYSKSCNCSNYGFCSIHIVLLVKRLSSFLVVYWLDRESWQKMSFQYNNISSNKRWEEG